MCCELRLSSTFKEGTGVAWAEVLSELGSQSAFCVSLRKGDKNKQFGIQTAFYLLPP